jgi:hypothetical protein
VPAALDGALITAWQCGQAQRMVPAGFEAEGTTGTGSNSPVMVAISSCGGCGTCSRWPHEGHGNLVPASWSWRRITVLHFGQRKAIMASLPVQLKTKARTKPGLRA